MIFLSKVNNEEQNYLPQMFPLVNEWYSNVKVTETKMLTNINENSYRTKYVKGSTVEEELLINSELKYKNIDTLSIGIRCFYIRIMKGYTIEKLSNMTNISYQTIFRYEHDIYKLQNIHTYMLQQIAITCGQDKYYCYNEYLKFRDFSDVVIKDYQNKNNINNAQLSKLCNVSLTTITKWRDKAYSPIQPLYEKYFKKFFVKYYLNNPDYF